MYGLRRTSIFWPPADSHSKLFRIQGDVIRNIYNHNIMSSQTLRSEALFSRIIELDHVMEQWKWDLPPSSALLPLEFVDSMTAENWAYNKTRTTLTLRFLNVRALLFRKVLERSLDQITKSTTNSSTAMTPEGSLPLSKIMIQACTDACIQTITIIRLTAVNPQVLPAWWYTVYYGKRESSPNIALH